MDTMVYLEWTDKQKHTHREKLIVYGIPPQFLSAFEANPVSMLSHVHPPFTMEGEGQGDTPQQGRGIINGFGQHVAQCVCICVFVGEWALSRLVKVFLCVAKYCTRALIVRVFLFGFSPRPCYGIRLEKQQRPWTGHKERSRERETAELW